MQQELAKIGIRLEIRLLGIATWQALTHKAGRAEMMTRILLKPVDISVSGERKRITALEAILLQLRAKELSDQPRASKVRLKYEDFARQNSQPRPRIVFVESDYTQAMAAKAPKKDEDRDL